MMKIMGLKSCDAVRDRRWSRNAQVIGVANATPISTCAHQGRLELVMVVIHSPGVITASTWNRIAFVADLEANTLTYYVNGTNVKTRAATGIGAPQWKPVMVFGSGSMFYRLAQ